MANKIEVYVENKNHFQNQFHKERLSPELGAYILEECKTASLREKIEIHIYCKEELDKREQTHLIDMIRRNYGVEIQELLLLIEKNRLMSLICILVGIFILFIYLFVDIIPILSEVILIIAWVFIWEGIYNLLFDGIKNEIDRKRLKKLTECKILFEQKK